MTPLWDRRELSEIVISKRTLCCIRLCNSVQMHVTSMFSLPHLDKPGQLLSILQVLAQVSPALCNVLSSQHLFIWKELSCTPPHPTPKLLSLS